MDEFNTAASGYATRLPTDEYVRKQGAIMPIPLALEALGRIVLARQTQEVGKLWIPSFHLLTRGIAMVGEKIAAAIVARHVDQTSEVAATPAPALRRVVHVQIENDTGIGLLGPG